MAKQFAVTNVFKHFKPLVEKQFSSIKTLRFDGGSEFINQDLSSFLTTNGISHKKSRPYTPQQNGVAERKHCRIIEVVISLMTRTSIPTKFLSFASPQPYIS